MVVVVVFAKTEELSTPASRENQFHSSNDGGARREAEKGAKSVPLESQLATITSPSGVRRPQVTRRRDGEATRSRQESERVLEGGGGGAGSGGGGG